MNRNFQKPTPAERNLPTRLEARQRYRHDHDQNPVHNLHGTQPSYRAEKDFDELDEEQFGEYPRFGKNINRAQPRKNFTGVGPKGYKRSDERIEEEVCERLAADRYIDASDILVSVENATVKLSGSVEDREDRTNAEMLVENVWGIEDIINDIKVKKIPLNFIN